MFELKSIDKRQYNATEVFFGVLHMFIALTWQSLTVLPMQNGAQMSNKTLIQIINEEIEYKKEERYSF